MSYKRKTVDFYKMEIYTNGEWQTVLDTDNVYEYRKLREELILKPWIKRKGKKYRIIKNSEAKI